MTISQKGNAHQMAGAGVGQGWQAKPTLKNTQLDYAPLADLVQANVNGQRLASRFLDDLRSHYADPDALYLSLKSICPNVENMESLATLRGFARILQKTIERGAA